MLARSMPAMRCRDMAERRFAEVGSEVGVLASRFCQIPGVNDEIDETEARKPGSGHLPEWHRHHAAQCAWLLK